MNELHLFAGAGGGILGGMLLGHTPVCAVEYAEYPRRVLLQRQRDGILPRFPIWDDVRTFDGKQWRGRVDVVCGGFPCQPFSTAARGGNIASKDMWKPMLSAIRDIEPRFVFAENVSERAITTAEEDLRSVGYTSAWTCLSASDLGADHIRERYWLLAHANMHSELRGPINAEARMLPNLFPRVWETYPNESRMADGVANRVDRIRATGNGQVPVVAATAFQILLSRLNAASRAPLPSQE